MCSIRLCLRLLFYNQARLFTSSITLHVEKPLLLVMKAQLGLGSLISGVFCFLGSFSASLLDKGLSMLENYKHRLL